MNTDGRLAAGQMFGRYQIVRVLGQGGMGVVYEAIHPGLKKRFAIKTLLPSVAEMPSVRARFLREGEATARIDHHHIVDVVDVGEQDGTPFLVMEFLDGESLADLLAARGRLDVAQALELLLPVFSAVAAAHAQQVVHRDLKPGNIFLARGTFGGVLPKVLDFGISKLIGDPGGGLTGTLTLLGTAAYMSPEQTQGAREIDDRSDQYSLGLILYETLAGRRAHDGERPLEVLHNIASGIFRRPREVRPDLPIEIEKIVLRMLALDPAARYPSLLDAGRALLPYASERVRVTLADAFPGAEAPAGASPDLAAIPLRRASGPPVASPAATTLRQAAAELSDPGGHLRHRRRTAVLIVAGVATLTIVAGAVIRRAPSPFSTILKGAETVPAAPAAASRPPEPVAPPPAPAPAPAATALPVKPAAEPEPPAKEAKPAPAAVSASAPSRHVHRQKPGRGAAAPAPGARDTAAQPKRGANNALIIK